MTPPAPQKGRFSTGTRSDLLPGKELPATFGYLIECGLNRVLVPADAGAVAECMMAALDKADALRKVIKRVQTVLLFGDGLITSTISSPSPSVRSEPPSATGALRLRRRGLVVLMGASPE
ncbi:MAG: hypothetical protein H0V84_01415 [Actinobacteria bacterium]|nr:hypothetical protein [Actinomycetota bacterium]